MLQNNLRKARENAGLTQTEMAKRLEITLSMYNYYELGLKVPTLAAAKKIANILNVSIDYLVDNEDWQKEEEAPAEKE